MIGPWSVQSMFDWLPAGAVRIKFAEAASDELSVVVTQLVEALAVVAFRLQLVLTYVLPEPIVAGRLADEFELDLRRASSADR